MQKKKNEKGITLIALVITIVVLFIILGVSVNLGLDSVDTAKDRDMQAELEIIQQAAVTEFTKAKQLGYTNSNDTPPNFMGSIVSVSNLPSGIDWELDTEPTEKYKSYYELTPENLAELEITNTDYTYIINYYTGEVYNKTKAKTSEDIPLYLKPASSYRDAEEEKDSTSFNDW